MKKDILTLGIESSCDETSVSVVKNGREILSNVIDTQIPIHEKYGGVVPEIASRNHIEAISRVTKKALEEANVKFEDIDAITPTYGPGLVGALLVGLSYAKALSFAINKPLVGVNHIQGHIAANYITYPELKPPFLCVMTSGGNTQLIHVKNYTEFEVLGKTRDDAIGEAFDKVARVVGLGYPGGPKVDKLAKDGNPDAIVLPKTHFDNLDFSFTVTEILVENAEKALNQTGLKTVALAGGVSANCYIREAFMKFKEHGVNVYMPDLKLCTDNAAMISKRQSQHG